MSEVATTTNGAADPMVSMIERAVANPEFDVAKLEALLRLRREEELRAERRAFNVAMAAAQTEMGPVERDAINRGVGNKYATLEKIVREMRPIYTAHGFSVRYGSAEPPKEGWLRIAITVAHQAGYEEQHYLDTPLTTQGPQGGRMAMLPVQAVGSAITYLRRYLLAMAFNIVMADDDDDGEATRTAPPPPPPPRPQFRPSPAPMPTRHEQINAQVPIRPEPDPLEESDPQAWLQNVEAALANAKSQDEVAEIGGHHTVGNAVANAPPEIRARVTELLVNAHSRFHNETM